VTQPEALRHPAEREFAAELAALAATDTRDRPPNWALSPAAVVTYVMGGTLDDGTVVSPKYVGHRRLIEIAVATLATDRALLLLGVPGTAKSWVSEHIAAAISGDSTLIVQGTAGTPEEAIRAAGQGPVAGRAGAEPRDARDDGRPHRADRGADPRA
jgi:hypothetical protein